MFFDGRIEVGQGIAAGDQARALAAQIFSNHAVRHEVQRAGKASGSCGKHDVSGAETRQGLTDHREHVARPNRGQHAIASDFDLDFSELAGSLRRQFQLDQGAGIWRGGVHGRKR